MIKVIIVEDIKPIREGLAALVEGTPELTCLSSYDSCERLFPELEHKNPDVILLDIQLNGMSGIEGIKKIKAILPKTNIVMLTIHEDNKNIFEALMAGAAGYLLKTTPPVQIIEAIKDANEGGSPMNSSIANKVIELMRFSYSGKAPATSIDLSERETAILQKISNGTGYKNIADELFISIHTVRYHIRNIYEKMQVHSQSEAISIALRKGLI
jgi:DNA-binding NarL/FixJ family response regulator